MAETSTKPYLIRAIHEWCTDSGYRPYIAVAVDERTVVPREFVRNGEIVLNVSADACNRLRLGNDMIEFEARFNRVARQVSIPVENVTAVYAAETGQGMAFEVQVSESAAEGERSQAAEANDREADGAEPGRPAEPARGPVLVQPAEVATSSDEAGESESPAGPTPTEPAPKGSGGRAKLTRIK
jgi:stringent starvation protein B